MPKEIITTKQAAIRVIRAVLLGKNFINHFINLKDLFKS